MRTENGRLAAAVIISLLIHVLFFIFCGSAPKHTAPEPVMNVKLIFAPQKRIIQPREMQKSALKEVKKEEVKQASETVKKIISKQTAKKQSAPATEEIVAKKENNSEELSSVGKIGEAENVQSANAQSTSTEDNENVISVASLTVLQKKAPDYPAFSRKRGEEGTVSIIATIENGRVTSAEVDTSSGFERLDASALRAIKEWKFDYPGKIRVRVPFVFRIR